MSAVPPLSLSSLSRYPNLRRLHAENEMLTACGGRQSNDSSSASPCQPTMPAPSLSSMRHLTRISLDECGQLSVENMRLLATLPVLASFEARGMRFESGDQETLRQWQALTGNHQQQRGAKRKAGQLGTEEAGAEVGGDREWKEKEKRADEREEEESEDEVKDDEDDDGEPMGPEATAYRRQEGPNDPSLPLKRSALLLLLHALAAKPSFVHLELVCCDITPFVLDHMPVWPHLLSLEMTNNKHLDCYRFDKAVACFPSLTSLSQWNCSDAANAQLVRLPALEERFPLYLTAKAYCGGVLTSTTGFRTFSRAPKLRAIYYLPGDGEDGEMPSLVVLTAIFTVAHLTRLTMSAAWLIEGVLSEHRFQHLRCLQLVPQCGNRNFCPESDELLLPLVKPLDVMVAGREQRQAARAARRAARNEVEGEQAETAISIIPMGNAANFPSLECLDLPYSEYNSGWYNNRRVSAWMKAQLRRSYEYEVAEEWEAEETTLGRAELLKSIMA